MLTTGQSLTIAQGTQSQAPTSSRTPITPRTLHPLPPLGNHGHSRITSLTFTDTGTPKQQVQSTAYSFTELALLPPSHDRVLDQATADNIAIQERLARSPSVYGRSPPCFQGNGTYTHAAIPSVPSPRNPRGDATKPEFIRLYGGEPIKRSNRKQQPRLDPKVQEAYKTLRTALIAEERGFQRQWWIQPLEALELEEGKVADGQPIVDGKVERVAGAKGQEAATDGDVDVEMGGTSEARRPHALPEPPPKTATNPESAKPVAASADSSESPWFAPTPIDPDPTIRKRSLPDSVKAAILAAQAVANRVPKPAMAKAPLPATASPSTSAPTQTSPPEIETRDPRTWRKKVAAPAPAPAPAPVSVSASAPVLSLKSSSAPAIAPP